MKNLVGNTLTVLILLMSCFFFAAALIVGAAQRNWKNEVAELTQRAETAERQVDDAKSKTGVQLKSIEREKVARAQQLANLFSEKRQSQDALEEESKLLKAAVEENQANQARLRESAARNLQLINELEAEQTENTQLKNNITEQFAKVKDLTQESFEQQTKIDRLELMLADLNADNAAKLKVMNLLGVTNEYVNKDIVPKLTATVAEIGQSRDTFAIKLGSDDGIRLNHEFDVYRGGGRYIGRARATLVKQDVAVLKSIRGLMKSNVQEGDYVTSKF